MVSQDMGRGRWSGCRQRPGPILIPFEMFVSDLRHFLDMPDDVPGPAHRMAEHLSSVVRTATAVKGGAPWVSALNCRRRPGHRPCPGHIAVYRADLATPIEWRCPSCGDEGVISRWETHPSTSGGPGPSGPAKPTSSPLSLEEVAATLRDLRLLDSDRERIVFGARLTSEDIVLPANDEDLDELIGFIAAEANPRD